MAMDPLQQDPEILFIMRDDATIYVYMGLPSFATVGAISGVIPLGKGWGDYLDFIDCV